MKKTHWKKMIDHNFINEGDLDAGNIIAKIASVALEEVTKPGGKKEDVHVLRFENNNVKPLILGAKANWRSIESALKTPYIEDWVGKSIEIYYDPKVKFGKEEVGGVRIKPTAPIIQTELTRESPQFAGVEKKLKEGKASIKIVKQHFYFDAEIENYFKSITNA